MTIRAILGVALAFGMVACAPQPSTPPAASTEPAAPAPAAPAGGGLAGNAEQQAKQAELEKATPQLKVTEEVLKLSVPGQTIGEAVGVAKNAEGPPVRVHAAPARRPRSRAAPPRCCSSSIRT